MSSTELFRKHFGDQSASVDLKHPNMEKFFSELNEECLLEDKQKQLRKHDVSGSVCMCEMPAKMKGKNQCWRCKKPFKEFLQTDR